MEPAILVVSLLSASKVSAVVVFPDRAQVTRSATVPCGAKAAALFEGIPPAADPGSFRARAEGASIEGLRAEERARERQYGPELAEVEKEIRRLEQENAQAADERNRADSASRLGAEYAQVAVAQVSREMAEAKPEPKGWASAFDASLAARLLGAQEAQSAAQKQREIGHKLAELRRKQARLSAAAMRTEHLAEVLVSCPSGATSKVELLYVVGGASWEPAYEARADEAGGAVELSAFATVRQSTGEDWKGVELVLSTALPSQNATPPELSALKVFAEERKEEKKVLVRREEHLERAETGRADAPAGEGRLRAKSQGLSVQLSVPEPADVPGSGTPVRLRVGGTRLRASFAYRSAPKLAPFVFRVADLSNSAPYPLLPGPVDVFRRGGFIARYSLERVAEGAAFHLTFGVEESLRVKRSVVEEVQREAGLFGGKRRFRYAYRFELANYGRAAAEVELSEHLPVSELDEVRVEIASTTSSGYELRRPEGIATWKVALKPSDKRKLELAFLVEVPSSYDSGGT
ncbi:MAG: mucoidy inhibitor MuiA family protein [Myxococcales bacterium]|nr:mucoidy inhibitor MuiA family protein [Myxococcales bacterium]